MIVKSWNIHWNLYLLFSTHLSLKPQFCYTNAQIWAVFVFPFAPGGITCVKICRWLYPKTNTCFVPMNDWRWNNKNTSLNKAWAFLKSRVCPLSVAIVKTLFGGFSQNSKQKLKYSISYILVNLSLSLSLSLPPVPLSCDMSPWERDETRNNNKREETDTVKSDLRFQIAGQRHSSGQDCRIW